MKSTKEEIQAIKTLLKDPNTAKYHKRLQIVLFRLMGKSYKEIIEPLDCNQTTIWRNTSISVKIYLLKNYLNTVKKL